MVVHYLRVGALLLLAASLSARQTDQVAGAEKERNAEQQKKDPKQKEKDATAIADLLGAPHIDKAATERGPQGFYPDVRILSRQ